MVTLMYVHVPIVSLDAPVSQVYHVDVFRDRLRTSFKTKVKVLPDKMIKMTSGLDNESIAVTVKY